VRSCLYSAKRQSQSHFERALAIAREQQAKSWELRAADGSPKDTLDLKQAKALLAELS
jgi:hypothetical protein